MKKETDKKRENWYGPMNTVFSVEEMGDPLWSSSGSTTTAMNRSDSEWFLQQYIEENFPPATAISVPPSTIADSSATTDEVEVLDNDKHNYYRQQRLNHPYPTAPADPEEYRALLKSKLHMACAVVAQRGSCSSTEENGNVAESQSQGSKPSQLGSQAQDKALPTLQVKSGVQVRQSTSGSSREDSDDDDLEGDMETTDNMGPSDEKRARRMRSNRESARRSRRRKQAHMNELETQVGHLRVEHSTLLKRLTEVNQKYEGSGVDNRILKADIETLRAKVKMAEETVKRVTGLPAMNLAMATVPSMGMPLVSSPMNASTNAAALPIPPKSNHFFRQQVPTVVNAIPHHQSQRLDDSFPSNPPIPLIGNPQKDIGGNRVAEMSSMQCRARVQQVQKQISPDATSHGTMPGWDPELSHTAPNNNKQN
ncbi:light-inducible protein CPRF2 isoform X2 [Corylus avellana]|uniref:light-inducible protein CPRF2 isoform X2 n=1 Tax=Corylus avellana TaxID=13451 RepID=UPI00286AAB97|nr:light-inducible protein CPRF2 isoform X2 [Corylus avellana]